MSITGFTSGEQCMNKPSILEAFQKSYLGDAVIGIVGLPNASADDILSVFAEERILTCTSRFTINKPFMKKTFVFFSVSTSK
jgi:hypothetical protein